MSSQLITPARRSLGWPVLDPRLPPLFRGTYPDQHLRVSDAERQAVTDRLSEHFADGRLDQAEFDERVGRAMNAKTRADLSDLFSDLPETGAPAVTDHPRRRGHPVLLLVLLVIVASAVGHLLWWTAGPVLWLAFVVVAESCWPPGPSAGPAPATTTNGSDLPH